MIETQPRLVHVVQYTSIHYTYTVEYDLSAIILHKETKKYNNRTKSGLKTAPLEQERNGQLLYVIIPIHCDYVASSETQYHGIHTNHIFRISFLH